MSKEKQQNNVRHSAYAVDKDEHIGWVFKDKYHPPSNLQITQDGQTGLVARSSDGKFQYWIKEDGKIIGFVALMATNTPTYRRIYLERLVDWYTVGQVQVVSSLLA